VYWDGPHCQFYRKENEQISPTLQTSTVSTNKSNTNTNNTILSIGFSVTIIVVVVVVIAGASYYYYYHHDYQRRSGKQRKLPPPSRKSTWHSSSYHIDEALEDSIRSFRYGEDQDEGDFQRPTSKFGGELI
jgi:hypothetical protein